MLAKSRFALARPGKKLGLVLSKEQWETVAGLIEGEIVNIRFHMQGWKESSSPYRRLEARLKAMEAILAEYENLGELGDLPYQDTDEDDELDWQHTLSLRNGKQ